MNQYPLFLALVAGVMLIPGPDTLVVLRTAMAGGTRAGVWAAAGSAVGNTLWGVATVLGVTAVLTMSPAAFGTMKLAGAAYLAVLGFRAALSSRRSTPLVEAGDSATGGAAAAFRSGLACDLANVKVGLFWTALVPQFLAAEHDALLPAAMVSTVGVMAFGWLAGYAVIAARMRPALARPRVARAVHGSVAVVFLSLSAEMLLV